MARTIIVILFFVAAFWRLQSEIRYSFRDLIDDYMWRILVIGLVLFFSLGIELFISGISLKESVTLIDILANNSLKASIYHWLEFVSLMAPGVTLALVYPPRDVFAIFNRYPEMLSRVSSM